MDKEKQIKSTDWLTKNYSKEELAEMKAKADKKAEEELKQKQIKEMYNDLFECISYDEWSAKEYGNETVDIYSTAEKLTAKGYRKESDVVREIFEEIECEFSPVCAYAGYAIKEYLANLKKKYIGE